MTVDELINKLTEIRKKCNGTLLVEKEYDSQAVPVTDVYVTEDDDTEILLVD
jgi:hypothetical protein